MLACRDLPQSTMLSTAGPVLNMVAAPSSTWPKVVNTFTALFKRVSPASLPVLPHFCMQQPVYSPNPNAFNELL
jgi:hypothetical protein